MKFIYAANAPHQSVALRVPADKNGQTRVVDIVLTPGKPVDLPEDHRFTRKMVAAGNLQRDGETVALEDDEAAKLAARQTAARGAALTAEQLAALDEGAEARLDAIAGQFGAIHDSDRTASGAPKVAAMSDAVGFKVTADEIAAAMEQGESQ